MRCLLAWAIVVLCVGGPVPIHAADQSYTAQATLAADVTFIDRVKVSLVKYAIDDVTVENASVARHDERLALAKRIVADPDKYARLMALGVAADLTFTAGVSDAAIFSRVAFIWNVYL